MGRGNYLSFYHLVIDQANPMNLTDLSLLLARPVFDLFNDPQMKTGQIALGAAWLHGICAASAK